MPTTAKIQHSFSEALISLFQQSEKEVETLKMLLILTPAIRKLLPQPPCLR